MSGSSSSAAAATLEESSTGILRTGFTGVSNAVLALLPQLTGAESKLILIIARLSNGFLQRSRVVGETRLMEETGLSRGCLYRAKRSLQQKGFVQVVSSASACRYELADALQSVKTAEELAQDVRRRKVRAALAVVPTRTHTHGDPSQNEHGDPSQNGYTCKERKEKKQHTAPLTQAHGDEPERRDDVFEVSSRQPALLQDAALQELVGKLQAQGVQAHVARQLVSKQAGETVKRALDRVELVKPRNAAGFLVAELQRGGYGAVAAAAVNPEQQLREKREQIAALRAAERSKEKQSQDEAQQRTQLWLERFKELPQDQQSLVLSRIAEQAEREKFTRIPGWSESHPVWAALVAEVMSGMTQRKELRSTLNA